MSSVHERKYSDEEILDDIERCDKKVEGALSISKYREIGKFSPMYAINYFGAWNNAKKQRDLEIHESIGGADKLDAESVKKDIMRIAKKHGEDLSMQTYLEHGNHTQMSIRGATGKKWNELKEELGLEKNTFGNERLLEPKEERKVTRMMAEGEDYETIKQEVDERLSKDNMRDIARRNLYSE